MKYKIISWSNGRKISSFVEIVDSLFGPKTWISHYVDNVETGRLEIVGNCSWQCIYWHKRFVENCNLVWNK